jgi:hypothetical protein
MYSHPRMLVEQLLNAVKIVSMYASPFKKVRKTDKGLSLKRWFKEDWTDEKGNECGSTKNKNTKKCRPSKKISGKTVKTWGEMSPGQKAKAVAEKKEVGRGKRASNIK